MSSAEETATVRKVYKDVTSAYLAAFVRQGQDGTTLPPTLSDYSDQHPGVQPVIRRTKGLTKVRCP